MTTDKIIELAHSCISSYKGDHTFECTSGDLVYFAASVINAEREKYQELIAAAEAVVDRWETPLWKDVEPTAEVIYRMRDVIERMKNDD